MSKRIELDAGLAKAAVWSGIALIVAMIIAQGFLMHFIPPPSPSLSAQELAQRFIDRRDQIRLGCLIQCIFWSFWATWGIAITLFIRKMERSYPIDPDLFIDRAGRRRLRLLHPDPDDVGRDRVPPGEP